MYLHAGVSLVHVDEHRSMCPDPELQRGAMRALAELPGVQVLETYTDSETCRGPIACLIPDVGTIMKERLPMVDIDMENEVATLHVTLGLALQKLLLVGLHFPSREIDRLFDRLNNILKNAGDDVKAEKRFPHAGGDTGQYSHSTTGVLLCDRDESRLLGTCFLSVGLQTSIENEPKSSCKSREDFGIRLSLGAGMQVVQIQPAGF